MKITVADLLGNRHELEFPGASVKISDLRHRLFQSMDVPLRSVDTTICYNGSVCDPTMIFYAHKMDLSIPVVLFDNSLFPERSFPRGVDDAFDFSRPRFSQSFVTEVAQREQEEAVRPLLAPNPARSGPRIGGRGFVRRQSDVHFEVPVDLDGQALMHYIARLYNDEREEEEEDYADQELEEDEEEERRIGDAEQQELDNIDDFLAFRGVMGFGEEMILGQPRMERAQLAGLNIQMTPDDEEVIDRLMEFGIDRVTVVQVYEICSRNEAMTRNCLMTMA
jgi:hypothetical protein